MKRFKVQLFDRLAKVTDSEAPISLASKRPTSPRGQVEGMSRKARRRLLVALAMVSRSDPCHFVTLTYAEFVEDCAQWHRDLDSFAKALARRFPHYCGFWRLQFQERGAPHFHLILWLCEEGQAEDVCNWASVTWCRITGDNSEKHQKYGADVQECGDFRATGFYLALYQGKAEQDRKDILTGRLWGMLGRSRLRLSPLSETQLNTQEYHLFNRVLRNHYKSRHRESFAKSGFRKALQRERTKLQAFLPIEVSVPLMEWVCSRPTDDPLNTPGTWTPRKLSPSWQW